MIGDNADSDDENIADVDELLVEEVSIDGMCGVDRRARRPVARTQWHSM